MTITVITSSDRAYRKEYEDLSGTAVCSLLKDSFAGLELHYMLIPDEEKAIKEAIVSSLKSTWILTTGGTGISPRDIVPEISQQICDKEIPGISEYLRRESLKETPFAVFSRGFSGLKGQTIIINLPGSKNGALFCTKLLLPLLGHGEKMVRGEGH